MFTHAEYELLRKRCPAELEAFLSSLALTAPSLWDDATRVKQLDTDATRCIAQKLHSTSLLDGCYTLLEDAGLPFDFSETTQTILERIAEHRAEVRAGMTKARPTPTAGEGRTAPEPRATLPRKGGGDVSVRYLGTGLIVADLVYLLVTAKASPVIVALLAVAGVFMVAKGGRSAGASQQPPPTPHTAPSLPHTAAAHAKFTEVEADDVLHALDLLRRLHQSF